MRVCVRSDDLSARELIETLACCDVEIVAVSGPFPDADLVFWDPASADELPPDLPSLPQIFLLRESDLARFHARYPASGARILLKPPDNEALRRAVFDAAGPPDGHFPPPGRANFMTRLLNDLQSPLTAAFGYSGLLADKCLGPLTEGQAESVSRLERSLQRVSALADAAFRLSVGRIEFPEGAMMSGNIEDCVEEAVQETINGVEPNRLLFLIRLSEQPPGLKFAPALITSMFLNLLENARRFALPGSIVEIAGYAVSRQAGGFVPALPSSATGYRVDVSDSGPGIPAELQGSIFDESAPCRGRSDRAGSGLGLAISRLIAGSHGGEIFADSRTDGATFSVILPADSQ